jgi:6-phosphogluconolactonase
MGAPESAEGYETSLRSLMPDGIPDLVLLGMGEDAHTASLFPGSAALTERSRWFVANEIPASQETRLTVTYPLLWRSRRLMVITAGAQKAEALRESFEGSTPAGRIGDGEAEAEWHVDRAAASLLS